MILAEAFLLADRVAVMREGHFVQVGTPSDIREHPASSFIADFVRSYEDSLRQAFSS